MVPPILKQGTCLMILPQSALTDADWRKLQEEALERVGKHRARGVIVDVSALDVLDSFACRVLRSLAIAINMRGAKTVIVGIQPEVAFSMAQLGLTLRLGGIATALDLEEGLDLLRRGLSDARQGRFERFAAPGRVAIKEKRPDCERCADY
jgi:rsbT antagonist protein RsbS